MSIHGKLEQLHFYSGGVNRFLTWDLVELNYSCCTFRFLLLLCLVCLHLTADWIRVDEARTAKISVIWFLLNLIQAKTNVLELNITQVNRMLHILVQMFTKNIYLINLNPMNMNPFC
jgi:hypothetical protein